MFSDASGTERNHADILRDRIYKVYLNKGEIALWFGSRYTNLIIEEVFESMQKTQKHHHKFEQENFKTFYCHVCMGSLGIFDECNDIVSEPEAPLDSMDYEPKASVPFSVL